MKTRNKGFTLIELLVVIAIISLLSSIVLASLNSARMKGKDAAIKEGVHQLENLMALNYSDYGQYCQIQQGWHSLTTCESSFSGTYATQAIAICKNIHNNAVGLFNNNPDYRFYSNTTTGCATSFSFMAGLNNGNWYCSGSSGRKGEYTYYGEPPNSNPGCYANP